MPSNTGLKVCTFNAKCDELDYKCCIKDSCCRDDCGNTTDIPDSLVAAMISVAILGTPQKADIYNIQNVKNKYVVEHLIKEICRVKTITDRVDGMDTCNFEFIDIACRLNAFEGLCDDARRVKDTLAECNKYKLDYVDYKKMSEVFNGVSSGGGFASQNNLVGGQRELFKQVLNYLNVPEYVAYYDNTSLTLVRKDLCLCPEVKTIPCVDSLVLFFKYCDRKLINVNIDFGDLVNSFDEYGCRKSKVEKVVCFLKEYKDCGDVIMAGPMGDLDYDLPQLLFAGDGFLPEVLQRFTANGFSSSPVPAEFPCDLCDPIYEAMEFLIKTCNAENIPYSWLLQYLRVKGCKKCCLYKLVDKRCKPKKCPPKCAKKCCVVPNVNDCMKCPEPSPCISYAGKNRSHLRQKMRKSDKCGNNKKEDECDKPACVPAKNCCKDNCTPVCKNKCKVDYKECHDCNSDKCEIKCKKPYKCDCRDDNKYLVKVDVCKDLCEKKSCCGSCANGGKCCDEDVCPPDSCEDFDYCDTVTVLKRDLCLFNTLYKIQDPHDRYTGFKKHFNRKLDCKYPKGMFQAWVMCEDYEKPCSTRIVDHNSELMALDHILVSDCLKNYVVSASMSDLCIEKCGVPTKGDRLTDNLDRLGINLCGSEAPLREVDPSRKPCVPSYNGSYVRAFFPNRVYCINFDFPAKKKGCDVACGETLHGLGLTSLWSAICSYANSTYGLKESCEGECVDICSFADFCLDKHPYFRDFFWNCVENKFANKPLSIECGAGDTIFPQASQSRVGDCQDYNFLVCFAKRGYICEQEFYKHLLCVLSHVDNRDRFVMIIATMDALYRTYSMGSNMLSKMLEKDKDELDNILTNKSVIKDLFNYLDKCFYDKVRFEEYMRGLGKMVDSGRLGKILECAGLGKMFDNEGGLEFDKRSGLQFNNEGSFGRVDCETGCNKPSEPAGLCNVINKGNSSCISALLQVLDYQMSCNCVVMEILTRYACRVMDLSDCAGDLALVGPCEKDSETLLEDAMEAIAGMIDSDGNTEVIREILIDLAKGKLSVTEAIREILRCTPNHRHVTIMLCIIGLGDMGKILCCYLEPIGGPIFAEPNGGFGDFLK